MRKELVIGLDFDNTLVSYDKVMYQTAIELGLIIPNAFNANKERLRDFIRSLPDGEIKWQKLQAEVYGKKMHQVQLIAGVEKFLKVCREGNIKTYIVSHKTKHAAQDREGINLQVVAFDWMKQNNFFGTKGLGFSPDDVYFEITRVDKVLRIKELGCTYFIDDLQEVFLEKDFPQETIKILYAPDNNASVIKNETVVARSWSDIYDYFFVKTKSIEESGRA